MLIYAAAKIFGRKVDYLEQEINGIAKNFASVETSEEKQPEAIAKKSRTKKFKISDSVNLDKVTFEEKPIQVITKIDINKTLAVPSRINRLQRMKEFFSKNKARTGKLVIPKSLLFTNDYVLSNFGSTQIHDYDDIKEIVGSRRDFTSFSHFINNSTGELQNDISSANIRSQDEDFHISNCENISDNILSPTMLENRAESPEIWATPPSSPFNSDFENRLEKDSSFMNFNIDEGIELDEIGRANLLMQNNPTVKLIDIRIKSPMMFSSDLKVNDTFDLLELEASHNKSKKQNVDETSPAKKINKVEAQMKNIFMIPLKKLKHRCLFDLPNDIFGELKQRKKGQHKSTVIDATNHQARIFKPIERITNQSMDDSEDEPFLGFTKEMQEASLSSICYTSGLKLSSTLNESRSKSPLSGSVRKYSDDSGLETDCSDDAAEKSQTDDQTNFDLTANEELNETGNETSTTINKTTESETDSCINKSSNDSCYHSCLSGDSNRTDLSSFFNDLELRNKTIDESEAHVDEALEEESEERVLQMQQSAINVS